MFEVTVKVSPSGSVSLVNTFPVTGVSISVLAASSLATKSLVVFVGFTYTVTVAVSQAWGVPLSQIWYVKVSSPSKPGVVGVYVIVPSGLRVAVPLAGVDTEAGVMVKVSPSISKSLASTTTVTGLVPSVVAVSLLAVTVLSPSTTGSTSILNIAVSQAWGVPLSHTV